MPTKLSDNRSVTCCVIGPASQAFKKEEAMNGSVKEDSQIDFATGNVSCTFLSDPHPLPRNIPV